MTRDLVRRVVALEAYRPPLPIVAVCDQSEIPSRSRELGLQPHDVFWILTGIEETPGSQANESQNEGTQT